MLLGYGPCKWYSLHRTGILSVRSQGIQQSHITPQTSHKRFIRREKPWKVAASLCSGKEQRTGQDAGFIYGVSWEWGWSFPEWPVTREIIWPYLGANSGIGGIFFFFFWEWAWPYSFLGAGNSSYSSKAIRKVAGGYLGYLATFPPWRAEMAVIAIRTQAIREVFWLGPDWWNSLDWGLASSVPWGFTKYTL